MCSATTNSISTPSERHPSDSRRSPRAPTFTCSKTIESRSTTSRSWGPPLWTDFGLLGNPLQAEINAEMGLNDFRHIRVYPKNARFRPTDARRSYLSPSAGCRSSFGSWPGASPSWSLTTRPAAVRFGPLPDDPLNPAFASTSSRWSQPAARGFGSTAISTPSPITKNWARPACWPIRAVIPPNRWPGFDAALVVEV